MKETNCAYCGKFTKCGKDHVIPRCLYPPSKSKSKIQRLTVPACSDCNNGWSDDEAHFRNVITVAGDPPNAPRQELWETKIYPSFGENDGQKRKNDLTTKMKPTYIADMRRYMIFPAEDERVMRIIRKIIRGLCHYHNIASPVSDKCVLADILKYTVPQGLIQKTNYYHIEQDIVEYRYEVYEVSEQENMNSAWLITFFQKVTFMGVVFTSENWSNTNSTDLSLFSTPVEILFEFNVFQIDYRIR